MSATFIILGSGAGPGVPSFFCDCKGCREARRDIHFARTRSGALIESVDGMTLIDTSPDLRRQLLKGNITAIDRIFLTHWHYDHFGGLGELEYYVKLLRREPIPLIMPPSAVPQFTAAYPNLTEVFDVQLWEFFQPYELEGLKLTPLPALHSTETAGFLVETKTKRLAYFPDTAGLPPESAAKLTDLDWFICDATFHGENWYPASHMSVTQAIELGKKIGAKNTALTHLAIHYSQPVTTAELIAEAACYGAEVAFDGMRIGL
ncbi:MAG: MBL fold metallo-hydrolase [Sporomusaceae bacterium]|jgi:phosphoribosyl 1,2-cyclic phosphate phosphodiesterase|nr:MBL fold metallo-hydrolase [Sporomusaceae bacterium]